MNKHILQNTSLGLKHNISIKNWWFVSLPKTNSS